MRISFDKLERIDIVLATQRIESAEENRIPVPEKTENSILTHGAMEHFDNEEGIQSEIRSSHRMILMLFQNACESVKHHCLEISKRPSNASSNKRSLEHILNCQKLVGT